MINKLNNNYIGDIYNWFYNSTKTVEHQGSEILAAYLVLVMKILDYVQFILQLPIIGYQKIIQLYSLIGLKL